MILSFFKKNARTFLVSFFNKSAGRYFRKPIAGLVGVRVARRDDLSAYLKKWDARNAEGAHKVEPAETSSEDTFILIVAVLGGQLIGHTSISQMWLRDGIKEVFSGGTWVHPFFRGIGIGGKMLKVALGEAEKRFLCPIYGNIDSNNEVSLKMCTGIGFSVVPRLDLKKIIENSFKERTGKERNQIIVRHDIKG